MRSILHRTFRFAFGAAPLALVLVIPIAAWRADRAEQLTLAAQSRLWVEGTSTVRSFACQAGTVNALVDTRSAGAIAQLLAGEKAVLSAEVKVPATALDCGNGTMNDHMREALKVNEAPTITFRVASYDVTRGAGGAVTGTLRGTLSLGGVQQPVTLTADGKAEGEMLRVTGASEVKMSDYALKPPSLMFGRIKVHDKVVVKFDLLLKS